ncbi:uncharacterized protein LOC129216026 isoform X2 [Uloborus diversus]|uniref:uncharacterized protein LOC129216026 isoform X2 n=1 Tax=Uloborus diversus TaxID=327109 RepID=UPI002408F589|nr:uncharacterized protein LOC129216026 isoform X2 [Uloborus diversus]
MGVASFLLVVTALGVKYVAGFDCNATTLANHCYSDLVHYEGLGFPLYGRNEEELNETCSLIADSFDCIDEYDDRCNGNPECDEECVDLLHDINRFSKSTRLRDLEFEICTPNKPLRKTYLENSRCLENNALLYAKCHNDSQLSQEFMATIQDPRESNAARCCFFSWYQDCFSNITRDGCSTNATFFVSFTLHKLQGHMKAHFCNNKRLFCDKAPLPYWYEGLAGELYDDEHHDVTENDIDNSIDDDIDNSIVGEMDASASAHWWSLKVLTFAHFAFVIYMHLF